MTFEIILPILIAFAIAAILGPIVIPGLKKMHMSNHEREELASHQKKSGTPSMGGIIFIVAVVVTCLIYAKGYPKVIPVMLVALGFGVIGFLDDILKVKLHRKTHVSDGLLSWEKALLQLVVTAVFAVYLLHSGTSLAMLVPFKGTTWDLPVVAAVIILFPAVIGTVNGVNFTDGLDGLASTITIVVAVFFTVAAVGLNAGLSPVCCAVIGALMGFLLYNVYPAKVFMGDTGSLFLGGFVAAAAYMMQMPIFILIAGLIYWVEIISVMIQVTYFRKTGGKRFFKMAPIHHHFELSGWSETRVVAVFSIVTAILCMAAYVGLRL
ncbi:MAG: phospho-N-acetylmuramoyl-pentapeptide-transferase [Clostridiales bacterium]|nr:phospho-N-acetylmuramoyl-pentapeptide-transferase [Clostridiales bacterium]